MASERKGPTTGYRMYNNGRINKLFAANATVPEGWAYGRLSTSNDGYKRSAQLKKILYYNNGVDTIKVHYGEAIPEGYIYEGKLKKPTKVQKTYTGTSTRVFSYSESKKLKQEIIDFVKDIYTDDVWVEDCHVIGHTIDVYIPKLRIGININDIYSHSTCKVDKMYHMNLTKFADEVGVRLIQICEDQWVLKQDICKSIIKSALGLNDRVVYARKCEVRDVLGLDEKQFLNTNHIQGYIASSKCIGLYYKDELVQLVSFRKSRFKQGEIELARQCSLLNTSVVGGFSKLMKHANMDCISYVDRSLFTGNSYYNVGFTYLDVTTPSYSYFKDDSLERLNRISCQKHRLAKLLPNFDESKTEIENMLNNGYLQVYDSGTLKVQYKSVD